MGNNGYSNKEESDIEDVRETNDDEDNQNIDYEEENEAKEEAKEDIKGEDEFFVEDESKRLEDGSEDNGEEYEYDPQPDGYQSDDESELEGMDNNKPKCPPNNPHAKISQVSKGTSFTEGLHGEIQLEEGIVFHFLQQLRRQ